MEIKKLQEELSKLLPDNRKLCKDCKWAKKDPLMNIMSLGLNGWRFGKCFRPQPNNHNFVDGKEVGIYLDIERKDWPWDNCGSQGKYFEKKK